MSNLMRSVWVFVQFFLRDLYVESKRAKDLFLNYVIAYPLTFSVQTAYFQSNTYFGVDPLKSTMLYTGNILLILMLIAYKHMANLLFDLESNRYINFQITVLSPMLVVIERILFSSVATFLISLPFLPMGALFFPAYIQLAHASILKTIIVLYMASLCCSAYFMLAILALPSINDINTLWARVNHVLMVFGGFWVPWMVMYSYSPALGYLVCLNPLIFITEGIRGAIVPSMPFIPFWLCIAALAAFSLLFTTLSYWLFKRRLDCL